MSARKLDQCDSVRMRERDYGLHLISSSLTSILLVQRALFTIQRNSNQITYIALQSQLL